MREKKKLHSLMSCFCLPIISFINNSENLLMCNWLWGCRRINVTEKHRRRSHQTSPVVFVATKASFGRKVTFDRAFSVSLSPVRFGFDRRILGKCLKTFAIVKRVSGLTRHKRNSIRQIPFGPLSLNLNQIAVLLWNSREMCDA